MVHGDKVKSIFEVVILIAFKPWGSPLFFVAISYFVSYFNFDLDSLHPLYHLFFNSLHFCATRLAYCVVMTCPWPQNDLLYRQHNLHACTCQQTSSGVCIMLYILFFSGSCMNYLREKMRLISFSKASSSDGTIFTFILTVRKITEMRK